MMGAIDGIADIMHIAGYRRKLALVVAVAENFEYLPDILETVPAWASPCSVKPSSPKTRLPARI